MKQRVGQMPVSDAKEINEYYQALLARDAAYLGTFWVGVKTTGIFCLPTCRARKPKAQNVAFFRTVQAALQHGYRACKVCRPLSVSQPPDAEVEAALALLAAQPWQKVSDGQLRAAGVNPVRLRRWFQQHYGVSFHAYQRMSRINSAYQSLQQGRSVATSAMDAGYDSLSGFQYMFQHLLQAPPQQHGQKQIIRMQRIETPLGPMFLAATDTGVCLLEFTDRRMLETELADLQKRLGAVILLGRNAHIDQAQQQLAEYFAGQRQQFSVPLHTPGSDFQQQVWQGLGQIGYGTVSSYQAQAQLLGRPQAVRAVANANGHNRVAIIIPCHRVIGKDGQLTGYGGGLARKQWLLEHERRHRIEAPSGSDQEQQPLGKVNG